MDPLFLLDQPLADELWQRTLARGARVILLTGSAVLMVDRPLLQALPAQLEVFVLQEDLELRGLAGRVLPPRVTAVDYAGFVGLTVEYFPVIHV